MKRTLTALAILVTIAGLGISYRAHEVTVQDASNRVQLQAVKQAAIASDCRIATADAYSRALDYNYLAVKYGTGRVTDAAAFRTQTYQRCLAHPELYREEAATIRAQR